MIAIPQAELHFDPPVFFRTDTWNGNEKGTSSVKLLYQSIKDGSLEMGVDCDYSPVEKDIIISWGGGRGFKNKKNQKEIYFEHGWLHRWGYQASVQGVNFKHTVINKELKVLNNGQKEFVRNECKGLQQYWNNKSKNSLCDLSIPKRYYVCPIQSPRGLFFRDVKSEFSFVFDDKTDAAYYKLAKSTIEKVLSLNIDAPIIFKQDPRDIRNYSELLELPDDSLFINSSQGVSLHNLLLDERCLGAIGINTNALHEAMVCGKKCIVFGQMVWDENRVNCPFPDFFDKEFFETSLFDDSKCMSYLYKLFSHQWYSSDFSNPMILNNFMNYIDDLDAFFY